MIFGRELPLIYFNERVSSIVRAMTILKIKLRLGEIQVFYIFLI